jgi:hypothetical protein
MALRLENTIVNQVLGIYKPSILTQSPSKLPTHTDRGTSVCTNYQHIPTNARRTNSGLTVLEDSRYFHNKQSPSIIIILHILLVVLLRYGLTNKYLDLHAQFE